MSRVVIIGNAGGGKSTLARMLARHRGLPHVEVDRLLWQEGWRLTPNDVYLEQHNELISRTEWVIDGVGQRDSIPARLSRATEVILIDMPLWMHFWLAAERQIAWASGKLEDAPGGIAQMPSTQALFKTIWDVDRDWMPEIRVLCSAAEAQGKTITRIASVEDLNRFTQQIAAA
jgi:adenylate kinase family enzyme